jgi:hypothetical protein
MPKRFLYNNIAIIELEELIANLIASAENNIRRVIAAQYEENQIIL